MHDEDIVCTCMSVSVRDIKTAIEAGASSFQEVQDATGAGTVCGACNDVLDFSSTGKSGLLHILVQS